MCTSEVYAVQNGYVSYNVHGWDVYVDVDLCPLPCDDVFLSKDSYRPRLTKDT